MAARLVAWATVFCGITAVTCAAWVVSLPGADQLPENGDLGYVTLISAVSLSWTLTGAVLVRVRPRNTVGWLILGIGAASAGQLGLAAYGGYGVAVAEPAWPMAEAAVFLACGLIAPSTFALPTVVLALYPDGRLPGPRWRWPVAAAVVSMAVLTAVVPFDSEAYDDIVPGREPSAVLPADVLAPLIAGPLVALALCALVIAAGTVRRLTRAVAPLRQQLAWMACVTAVFLVVLAAFKAPVAGAVACCVPVAVAVGVLRHNMLGIEVVLRRGIVYGALTAVVLGGYALVTAVAGSALHRRPLPGVVAAALVAVALTPLRERLQRAADRLVYGVRRDPLRAVADLGAQAASQGGPDMLPGALRAVARALRAPGAVVTDLDGHPMVSTGPAFIRGVSTSLRAAGADVATLTVAVRGPDETYGADDLRLLDALASQLAVIVRAVELTAAVEQERDRILEATRTERDRIRRDLHDGLGPALSGIGLGLDALGDALDRRDTTAQQAFLARIRAEVFGTVAEIRRVIEAMRPGALDGPDLAEAVRRHARSVAYAVPVSVTMDDLPSLPADVEIAVYRIVAEAVTNAVRHARAQHIWVTVRAAKASLQVTVVDDGRGADGSTAGVGLDSMRRRSEALGGTFRITSQAYRGTTVAATLPL
ncbi:sensor histidine kinase [Streptomyces sp. NBC_00638]|uniref:sensor histidine kinase n=1 Tax=Streptomyces sp. NBC_00638 TaxID=2975794 RepID=UPI00225C2F5B|nr:sensor histidine kinase [Streptomyces sp. NBC_00638]MCX5009305.1 sensor histidine kinase [Streptomyces sp. NBC_00638]